MTWASVLAMGSGALEFRLVIEGLPYEFVTDQLMTGTTGDVIAKTRIKGLVRQSLRFEETAAVPQGEVEADGMTVEILDEQKADLITQALAFRPSVTTWLTADLTAGGTTLTLASTAGMAANDVIHIGLEAIKVGAVASATSLTGCSRGLWCTVAVAHYTSDGAELAMPAVYLARPRSLEGRRAFLFAYGSGDVNTAGTSLTQNDGTSAGTEGGGTLIWRGRCATDARLGADAATWEITIDPITAMLDTDLGKDLGEPCEPRGIYYPWNEPFQLQLGELATSARSGAASLYTLVTLVGFYETQDEFCAALNTSIATAIAAAGFNATSIRAVSDGPDGWHLVLNTSGTARYVQCIGVSDIDPQFSHDLFASTEPPSADDTPVATVAATTTYRFGWRRNIVHGAGTVPRGSYHEDTSRNDVADQRAAFPGARIYLGGTLATGGLTSLLAEWANGTSDNLEIVTSDATQRYVELRPNRRIHGGGFYTASSLPVLKPVRRYATGHLGDFFTGLTTESVTSASTGAAPAIYTEDVNEAAITTVVTAAGRGRPWTTARYYDAVEEVSLKELVAHECRLLGVFPCTNSAGAIIVRQIRTALSTDYAVKAITTDEVLIDQGLPTWERARFFGQLTSVLFKTGYDPQEGEHTGPSYLVRDVTAAGERPVPRTLEIAPLSRGRFEEEGVPYADCVAIAQNVLSVFASDYAVVTIEVPLSCFSVLLGDIVTVTSNVLPDTSTGRRGVTAQPGFVIGRTWDLAAGRGSLTMIVSQERRAGYAPCGVVTTQVNTSGNTWVLTLSSTALGGSTDLQQTGHVWSDHFVAGAAVRIALYDSVTASSIDAVVDSATSTTVTVTFVSVWTPAASTWVLSFDKGDDSDTDTYQQSYAYWAGATGRIAFATAVPAQTYS